MVLVDTFSFQHPMAMNELTQAFSLPFLSPQDTIFWEFGYLASDSSFTDTIYSCGLSLVWDTIPDPLDRWNFGPKFPLTILSVTAKIKFTIPVVERGHAPSVQLIVYDVLGNEIAILVNEEKPVGSYEVKFDASGLTSGIYFYQLRAGSVGGGFVETKKMIILK